MFVSALKLSGWEISRQRAGTGAYEPTIIRPFLVKDLTSLPRLGSLYEQRKPSDCLCEVYLRVFAEIREYLREYADLARGREPSFSG